LTCGRRCGVGLRILEVEVLPPQVLLHAAGEAVGDVVRVDAWEVQVPQAEAHGELRESDSDSNSLPTRRAV
jgi:hypothetical protein